jgi:hypothetical protein
MRITPRRPYFLCSSFVIWFRHGHARLLVLSARIFIRATLRVAHCLLSCLSTGTEGGAGKEKRAKGHREGQGMTTQKVKGKVADLGGEGRVVGWMVTCVCVCVCSGLISKIGFLFLSVPSTPSMCDSQTEGFTRWGTLCGTPFVATWGGAIL